MTPEEYCAFPEELKVRETHTDHQILVTTMTGRRRASKADLAQLYARRWNVELDLRNIKTRMGMEVLHCWTPDMRTTKSCGCIYWQQPYPTADRAGR
jgi:hypothetical protein